MFYENIQSLIHKYYDTGPFTSEWQIDGKWSYCFMYYGVSLWICVHFWFLLDAFAWINVFHKEIHSLKEREKLLKEHLAIFGLSQPDSLELAELEEVRWSIKINLIIILHRCRYSFTFFIEHSDHRDCLETDRRMGQSMESLQERAILEDRNRRDGHSCERPISKTHKTLQRA